MNGSIWFPKSAIILLALLITGCTAPLPVDGSLDGLTTGGSTTAAVTTGVNQSCPECNTLDSACANNAACSSAISHNMLCMGPPLTCLTETESSICNEYGKSIAATGLRTWSELTNCVAYCLGTKVDNCADERADCEAVPGCLEIGECISTCKCEGVDDMGNGSVDAGLVTGCMKTCQGEPSTATTAWAAYAKCLNL